MSSIDISASGLSAQRRRLDIIANNIANAETTRTAKGGPYRRQQVVFTANDARGAVKGVNVTQVTEDPRPPKIVYRPGHPDADEKGFVAMPNVNVMEEMVDMVSATRSYEANVAAINAAKKMIRKALEISRR
ncbi:MAG: flagellar basal body rod protein FlgC [Armatimonadetes bacterium]|nr:flagellar basal body rod protein FlgC [Armatimonadota bacterium]NIM24381.1 flagellar basal body rod protein FlgC [Armatimonadota bacterium]NIM68250.1 flagellar basal body rod protein FlgC [Armatimonadota bacterium]NIM75151.1 flagellar basal body rod protein FlgC [Armatimonadota bacterium]NIN06455.1 flagellar basal body rod protein FlgC [Armatimonadota bacterium]